MIGPPAAAVAQTRARLGFYYFDGWSGPLTGFHFQGLPLGPYQDREPLSGWQDSSTCAMERQLANAHNFGINFFIFEWYYNALVNNPGENLNSALKLLTGCRIVTACNSPSCTQPVDHSMFRKRRWTAAVDEWVSYMTDPDYVRVNGMPLLLSWTPARCETYSGFSRGE